MTIDNKPIEQIRESDLQTLIVNQVAEGKSIDYKRELPSGNDESKRELLADVSSFANASGGYLVFGVEESAGIPTNICGLSITDADAEIRRIESSIQDGISPRIPGLAIKPINLQNKNVVIVVHIPRSWALPHMVTFKNYSKFYSRNSAGKYQLDVNEIRSAFLLSESAAERIRNFRLERLGIIVANQTPIPMEKGAKLILHVVPISAFNIRSQFDVISISTQELQPLNVYSGWNHRINLDGKVTFEQSGNPLFANTYLQIFRNGVIEAVETHYTISQTGKSSYIYRAYERDLLKLIERLIKVQENIGVQSPLFIMLSFLGVKGYVMGFDSGFGRFGNPIDRDALLLPVAILEDYNSDLFAIMKPIFDNIWNACGHEKTLNFDDAGNWIGGN